jgi:peptide/nickel transport system ATP-binding protein
MLIAARQLKKHFQIKGAGYFGGSLSLKAVDGVDIQVKESEIVGVVGESGSGKSTLGRMLMGILKPTSGHVLFDIPDAVLQQFDEYLANGEMKQAAAIEEEYSVFSKKHNKQKDIRKKMNIVFQDPYSSLDPRMNVIDIITEPIAATDYMHSKEAKERCFELLDEVGLPRDFAYRYPHELSGGQRQRVALARGIATLPKFLVLDEPTSALDVSVQAQILSILRRIREKYNIGMILITHNIAVISYMADQVNVMYAGKIVETGPKRDVLLDPVHPYNVALISAVPGVAVKAKRIILKGDTPNLIIPPCGCRFHPRCPVAYSVCGWTADEVASDLKYLIEDKYIDMFPGNHVISTSGSCSIVIKNTSRANVEELIKKAKEESHSLEAIDAISECEGGVELKVRDQQEPKMYQYNTRMASCFLYAPDSEKLPTAVIAELYGSSTSS